MSDAFVVKPCDKGKQLVLESPEKGRQLAVLKPEAPKDTVLQGNCIPYPEPLAKYKDVEASPELFMGTLEKLHATMGTKFMVPTIGGRELDLHRLFVEVTSRGGIEKGWVPPPSASLQPSSATTTPPERLVGQKRRRNNGDFSPAGVSLPTNREVVGVIDGKFEHGYFITVAIGSEKLKGVLYPAPEKTTVQRGIADYSNVIGGVRRRRRRRKLSKRDPTHPKPNRSGYNFFFAEQHARLKPLHPGKDREISKMIGDLWNKLTETEKAVYQERGLKDKERYRSEMAVYREKLKMGPIISNAVPIQECPAEPDETEVMVEDVDSKMEMDEGDLPSTNQNDSCSYGSSDTEEKMSGEDDSETETSPELGGTTAAESSSLVAEPSTEGDGFELQKRDNTKMENEHDLPNSSEDT